MIRTKKIAETRRTNPRGSLKPRLLSKCKINPDTNCWEWMASVRQGYGSLAVPDESRASGLRIDMAHRLSWEVFKGAIPNELCVLHRCDNRCCINPDHLFLGTKKDNAIDAVSKGRFARLCGERNPATKLTATQVLEAREFRRNLGLTFDALASRYKVDKATIHRAVTGRGWKELQHACE